MQTIRADPRRHSLAISSERILIESLRDHSVLSLIWALSKLRERSRTSFIFVEPTWFGYSHDPAPNAEADLLVVLYGQAFLCEVKSSWHRLRASDIADLVALAKRLRPNTALLAVMEAGSGLTAELTAARAHLATERIKFELLIPDTSMEGDDPYLNFDEDLDA